VYSSFSVKWWFSSVVQYDGGFDYCKPDLGRELVHFSAHKAAALLN